MTLNVASQSVAGSQSRTWTLESLVITPSAELDDIFRAAPQLPGAPPAGQMPAGNTRGIAILGGSQLARRWWAGFARTLCWQGKVFDQQNEEHATLVNKIFPIGLRAIKARVHRGPSRLDGRECIILDYSQTSLLARWIRDEIREVAPGIYLGLVYWGSMRKPMLRFALATQTGQ